MMSLGGVNFHDSVTQSLHIGSFVRKRAQKSKLIETPINCTNGSDCVIPANTDGTRKNLKKNSRR